MKKYALVSGGTKGIGRGITLSLLDKGYIVVSSYMSDEINAIGLKDSLESNRNNLHLFRCDMTNIDEVYKLISFVKELTDSLDCLVCNAGVTIRKKFEEITDQDWINVMQGSVTSNFILVREFQKYIPNGSRIVFIGSLMGIYSHATSLVYGVSKAAVHAMAQNLLKEFEYTNTTINVIVPGFVETDWQKEKPKNVRDSICEKTALGRFAKVSEIVSAFNFCLENSFLNGSLIEVSGGYSFK